MFTITKIIAKMFSPLVLFFELAIVACIFLYFKKRKISISIFIFASMLLYFFSSESGQDFLAKPLENSIPIVNPLDCPNIKSVVVMGNGLSFPSNRPANAKLSNIAVARLVEGVRVFNLTQADKIFFTGRNFADRSLSIAAIMKQSAIDLGVDEAKIITVDDSRNSREEARYLSEYLKGDAVFLVSSAAHLKRAKINFENAGIFVVPMPTDYQTNDKKKKTLLYFLPNPNCLANSEKALHEYRGLLWEKVRKILYSGK